MIYYLLTTSMMIYHIYIERELMAILNKNMILFKDIRTMMMK